LRIVGGYLVEVAPIYDQSEQTAYSAIKLIREMILGWVHKK
ncbi:agmatinase, partial [Priestia megaterium]